ncbi:MAG: hypothetical protein FWE95_06325 [Planctomycetaceae bacterium]|nr:hypothetical protein [Planctomycetaceae bacterium]
MSKPSQPTLPPNIRLTVEPERLEIVYTSRNWVSGLTLLLIGTIVAAMIVGATIQELEKGATWSLFIAIPFYLVSLFMLGGAVRCFCHREVLRIDSGGLDWRLSAIITIFRRRIPWEQLVTIQKGCRYEMVSGSKLINGWGVGIETDEKTFYLFLDLDYDAEGKKLQQHLKKFIADFRKRHQIALPMRFGESENVKIRRRESLRLRETPEYVELCGTPEVDADGRFFAYIWTTIWTIGCIASTYIALFPPKAEGNELLAAILTWSFLIVLWTTWLFAVPYLFMLNWRVETLRIKSEYVEHRTSFRLFRLVVPTYRRRVSLSNIGLCERYNVNNSESGIQIPTTGRPIRCFKSRGDCKAFAFIKSLNERLEQYGVTKKSRLQQNVQDVPFDSRWKMRDDGITKTFTRRGRLSARYVLMAIFACVFISCFIAAWTLGGAIGFMLEGHNGERPPAAAPPLIMIPFVVIFGVIFVCLIVMPYAFFVVIWLSTFLMLLQFLCRYTITLDDRYVRYRRSWFGIGRRRVWMLSDIDAVSVRQRKEKSRWRDSFRNPEAVDNSDGVTNPYPFFVQFLGSEKESLGIIPDLLGGEAQWLARHIRQKKTGLD